MSMAQQRILNFSLKLQNDLLFLILTLILHLFNSCTIKSLDFGIVIEMTAGFGDQMEVGEFICVCINLIMPISITLICLC